MDTVIGLNIVYRANNTYCANTQTNTNIIFELKCVKKKPFI